MADPRFLLLDLEAVGEEVEQFTLSDRHAQAVGIHDLNDTQSRTTQREGIARSRRLLVDPKEGAQRIQLVRQRHRHRDRRGRHIIALPDRLVMIADRICDGIRQAFGAGIIASHNALQFGELADHFGDEIRLGQTRRLFREVGQFFLAVLLRRQEPRAGLGIAILDSCCRRSTGADNPLLHQPPSQLRHPLDLVRDRAQLLVEGDALQLPGVIRKARLAVLLPEEARIAQPRAQHLSVAGDDRRATILRLDIGGADEGRGQLARCIAQHEIFLVDPQG